MSTPQSLSRFSIKACAAAFLALSLSGSLMLGTALAAKPQPATQAPPAGLHVIGAPATSKDVQSILTIIDDLLTASNKKDLDTLLKHYSPHFISGDNMSLEEVRNLILETWEVFPKIQYKSTPLEVRVHGDWATVESIDEATAPTEINEGDTITPGKLTSRSRGLLYLHRTGTTWEIRSDYTLYEQATILYGPLQDVNITLSTPEQVFAGEPYTAKVEVDLPASSIAFATISREPLVYPQVKPKDKFRTLSSDRTALQRIFGANTLNTNEIVTATLGLTQIGQDQHERPTVDLKGVATVVKRVNVIPLSQYVDADKAEAIVRESADGTIKIEPAQGNADDEDVEEAPLGSEDSPPDMMAPDSDPEALPDAAPEDNSEDAAPEE